MDTKNKVSFGELARYRGQWLTVKELAARLSVHPDTVRRWVGKGQIKCVRHPMNNYRLFRLLDLYLEKRDGET